LREHTRIRERLHARRTDEVLGEVKLESAYARRGVSSSGCVMIADSRAVSSLMAAGSSRSAA
jgi:hypothetical protein